MSTHIQWCSPLFTDDQFHRRCSRHQSAKWVWMMHFVKSLLHLSGANDLIVHYDDVIMTTIASQITSLTSVYSTVYSDAHQRKIKAPRHWPLCGEFTGTGEFPAQRASYAENVSIWWRHHDTIQWYAPHNYWFSGKRGQGQSIVTELIHSLWPSYAI